MKTLILILLLAWVPGAVAAPINPDLIPHIDKAFLYAPQMRDGLVVNMRAILKSFCETVAGDSEFQLQKVDPAALESCQFFDVVASLQASESELGIQNGEPFMMRIESATFDEAAVWRYFIRTQKVRRLIQSLRIYFSHGAELKGAQVGLVAMPLLAGALDNYSYWTRLISMGDASRCPDESMNYCKLVGPQLPSLALRSWQTLQIPASVFALDDKSSNVLLIAKAVRARLSVMTLDELNQLEKIQDVTSAGLGIPYFRQLLNHFEISDANVTMAGQKEIQRAILLNEIRDALARWTLPEKPVDVNAKSVMRLEDELKAIAHN